MILHAMWVMGGFSNADWTDESNQQYADYGWSLWSAGDVNGDGYDDVVVGAPFYDNGQLEEGRAWVYHGSAAGLAGAAAWTTESEQTYAYLGWSVAGGGDVNGDGYDDVIVGSIYYDAALFDAGRVWVYNGSATGLGPDAAWTADGIQAYSYFGATSAIAGDVNGDGYDDVILGAYLWDNVQFDEGALFVFHGSATGLSKNPVWSAESNVSSSFLGYSVATAGDVNGDGYDDVIAGCILCDNGEFDEGRAFAYYGSATGLGQATWSAESNQNFANSGYAVSTAGDVNADGYDDVIVGTPYWDNGEFEEGQVALYLGSATGLDTAPAWTYESNSSAAFLGYAASAAGDVNADGFDDVIVGAFYWDAGTTDEGAALIFLGTATGLDSSPYWIVDSNQGYSYFGASVAPGGDVDGDGYDDVLVGARYYDNGDTDEGRAYLFGGTCADPIDSDGDQAGDLCDVCPGFDDRLDSDLDGAADGCDVCPATYDPTQLDDDDDNIGDACDPCPMSSPDADNDGFCAAQECDDNNGTVFPGAPELCDGLDNACTGAVPVNEIDGDGDGEAVCQGDCDDADPDLFTGQVEICNDRDDNCDGRVGPDEADEDGDHSSICDGDCDDSNVQMAPHLYDLCGDDMDNDCDGAIDQTCGTDGTGSSGGGCAYSVGGAAGAPLLALAMFLRTARRRRGTSLTH